MEAVGFEPRKPTSSELRAQHLTTELRVISVQATAK